MLRSEFREIAEEVGAEMLPKVKSGDRDQFITELMTALADQGLEIEDDEYDQDEDDEDTDDSTEDSDS